jgi:diguanylate cyclase (GGDEF)-like protein/PAS domain S-box-containing protein
MPTRSQFSDEFLFSALMSSTADSIYFKDRDCRYVRASKKMAMDLGYDDPAGLVGKSDVDLFGLAFGLETRRDEIRVMETDRALVGTIESVQLPNGRHTWALTTKLPMHDKDGNVIGLLGITREINEIRQVEMALQHLATHDSLTDLPNRYLMLDRLNQLLARARGSGAPFAILFMDIDGFKAINDAHGHEFGDLLLKTVAQRLTKNVRHGDTVARMGGDEFVVVLDMVAQMREADAVARHIGAALAKAVTAQHHRVNVTASIGIAFFPENGGDVDTLLKAADYAMYLAKREGGNRCVVCPAGALHPGLVLEKRDVERRQVKAITLSPEGSSEKPEEGGQL